jgi:hypothetical protein
MTAPTTTDFTVDVDAETTLAEIIARVRAANPSATDDQIEAQIRGILGATPRPSIAEIVAADLRDGSPSPDLIGKIKRHYPHLSLAEIAVELRAAAAKR